MPPNPPTAASVPTPARSCRTLCWNSRAPNPMRHQNRLERYGQSSSAGSCGRRKFNANDHALLPAHAGEALKFTNRHSRGRQQQLLVHFGYSRCPFFFAEISTLSGCIFSSQNGHLITAPPMSPNGPTQHSGRASPFPRSSHGLAGTESFRRSLMAWGRSEAFRAQDVPTFEVSTFVIAWASLLRSTSLPRMALSCTPRSRATVAA